MPKKLIYVACGSGAASANLVKERLKEYLKKMNIDAELVIGRISEIPGMVASRKPDAIIVTVGSTKIPNIPPDIPVLYGLPLMTMVNVDKFLEELKRVLSG